MFGRTKRINQYKILIMLTAEPKIIDTYADSNRLFPIFLKLEELQTLIIGGGYVGLEKLTAVINNSPGAKVTLIAPSIKDEIIHLALRFPNIRLLKRAFLIEDLDDKDILIAATNDKKLNSIIKNEAKAKKILTNVADTPELCDFYLGSIVKKGSVKIAISTNGKSPTIAKRLREILDNSIPDEMENVLNNLVKIRSGLNGNFSDKVKRLNKITTVLAEQPKKKINFFIIIVGIISAIILMISGHLLFQSSPANYFDDLFKNVFSSADSNLHWFILTGFVAQLIDGALGMGYGVSATSFLLAFGLPPVAVSASVHTSEIFTSGASGLMHLKFGNVDKKLCKKLILPGVLGAVIGAFTLSSLSEYNFILKPIIASYTLILGVIIILKAVTIKKEKKNIRFISPLAVTGGFLDSVGGGGWGPIVSSTLIAKGNNPAKTIGAVNLAEFFVAFASSAAFITVIGLTHWQVIAALIFGGLIAAPIAAKTAGKLPLKTMMVLVGALVISISLKIIYSLIF
jgi:uncharacterized protein